jgi:hypothetical protein
MRFFRLWKYLSELHKTEYTKSFCVFSSYFRTIKDNWIKVFTDSEHSEHLKSLLIKIRIDVSNYNNIDEIKKSFQSIIESSNANDWRINFFRQPGSLIYHRFRQIAVDRDSYNKIYLPPKNITSVQEKLSY